MAPETLGIILSVADRPRLHGRLHCRAAAHGVFKVFCLTYSAAGTAGARFFTRGPAALDDVAGTSGVSGGAL